MKVIKKSICIILALVSILALNALGYSQAESLKVVSKIDITPEMDVEDILRLALKNM